MTNAKTFEPGRATYEARAKQERAWPRWEDLPCKPTAKWVETEEAAAYIGRGQGMAIAAGIVMRCWGDTTHASEILGAAGFKSVDDMRACGVDDYDIEACAPVFGEEESEEDQ